MDIALKQRLVGATILIALAVIFLPLLLDGENRDGQSTQPIEIPDRPDVDFQRRRLPVGDHEQADAADTTQPQPQPPKPQSSELQSSETAQPQSQQTAPEKPVAEPVTRKEPEPAIKKPVVVANGNWLVQIGSFGSLDNANRLGADLEGLGYAAMLEAGGGTSNTLVRVKIGPFNTESEAVDAAQRVRGAISGVSPRVISVAAGNTSAAAPVSGWIVQLGSFSAGENAAKLSATLQQQGFTVFTDQSITDRGIVFKVRTGVVPERADAEGLRDRIRARSGTAGMVINLAEQ